MIAGELFVGSLFLVAAAGTYLEWPVVPEIAAWIRHWWAYELTGSLFLAYYLEYLSEYEQRHKLRIRLSRRLGAAGIVYGIVWLALLLVFGVPLGAAAVSALLTLPFHAIKLAHDRPAEKQVLQDEAAACLGSFVLGFFPAVLIVGWLAPSEKAVESQVLSMLLAGFYFPVRGFGLRAMSGGKGPRASL